MDFENTSIETIIFQFIDQWKFLFFPEKWNQTFLDYSKNEAFTLLLIYRKGKVNMTEVAEYLDVPLNTVTGIVSRLEKRRVVIRERDKDDKRIVVVSMSFSGEELVKEMIEEFSVYFKQIISKLTTEEIDLLMKIVGEVFEIFKSKEGKDSKEPAKAKVKRIFIE